MKEKTNHPNPILIYTLFAIGFFATAARYSSLFWINHYLASRITNGELKEDIKEDTFLLFSSNTENGSEYHLVSDDLKTVKKTSPFLSQPYSIYKMNPFYDKKDIDLSYVYDSHSNKIQPDEKCSFVMNYYKERNELDRKYTFFEVNNTFFFTRTEDGFLEFYLLLNEKPNLIYRSLKTYDITGFKILKELP